MTNEELSKLLTPPIAGLGLEFVGIEFNPSHGSSLLRVYIDALERPVTLEDCERVSREISALMDVHDPVAGRYTLEVSSPGLDRPLFTLEQFARFIGQVVKISVNVSIAGRRRFQGPIRSVEGEVIVLEQDGAPILIEHSNVLRARLVPDYVELGLSPTPKQAGKSTSPARRKKLK